MKKIIGLVFLACSLSASNLALGETAYIVDQLLVGLHQEKDIDSPIIKVLSTGTEVEILIREGDYAQIRELAEGKTGWVDASYLMLDQPAKVLLTELQEKIKTLESQQGVQASQAIKAENEKNENTLNNQIEDLKQNLSSEKLKAGELEAKISHQEKKLAQIEANGDENQIADLETQNRKLQSQLDAALQDESEQIVLTNNQPPLMQLLSSLKERPIQILLGVLALAAFLFGRRWEDKKIRRRHGGFRV